MANVNHLKHWLTISVIFHGDLTVNKFEGRTCISFRMPSQARTDYTGRVDVYGINEKKNNETLTVNQLNSQKIDRFQLFQPLCDFPFPS